MGIQTFVSYAYRQDFQPTYNIILTDLAGLGGTVNHWMFNIKEGKWSRHGYVTGGQLRGVIGTPLHIANQNNLGPQGVTGFIQNIAGGATTSNLFVLQGGNGSVLEAQLDANASFVCPALTLQPSYDDTYLTRIMIVVFCATATTFAGSISIVVTSKLDSVLQTTTFQPTNNSTLLHGWNYLWFQGRAAGQDFQATVTLGALISPTKVKEMWFEFTTSGKQRG
jgi:hypothetical protein